MDVQSLTEIWQEKARAGWQEDFDDLNREQGGAQGNRKRHFFNESGPLTETADNKSDNNTQPSIKLAGTYNGLLPESFSSIHGRRTGPMLSMAIPATSWTA